jgi:hypothetical protein
MQVQRLSPAKTPKTNGASLEKGVAGALQDIRKIQGRMTEELRAEDPIANLSVKGGKVVVEIDGRFSAVNAAGIKDTVKEHLAKHGIKNVAISVVTLADPQEAIEKANAELATIQARLTKDLRSEDGVSNLVSKGGNQVAVVFKAQQHFSEAEVLSSVKALLARHGLKNAQLEVIRPAINIRPVRSVVDEAMASIKQVQQRLTADMRAEDDIVNLSTGGHGGTSPGEVRVVLRARPHFSEADIKKAVVAHLERAGLTGADISFIRPRILPMRPPTVDTGAGGGANKMKAKVDVLAADIRTVQSRMTEEIRVEDSVKTIKVVGAKVVVTLNDMSAVTREGATEWLKEALKTRGITLPLVVKA